MYLHTRQKTHVPWSLCERLRGDFTFSSYEEVRSEMRETKALCYGGNKHCGNSVSLGFALGEENLLTE